MSPKVDIDVSDMVEDAVKDVVKHAVKEQLKDAKEVIKHPFKEAKEAITHPFKEAKEVITHPFKEAVQDIREFKAEVKKDGGFIGHTAAAIHEAATGQLPGTSGKHPISAVVGTALTGGRKNAGTRGYLAVCVPLNAPCARVPAMSDDDD